VGYLKGGGFQKNPHNSGNETASNQRLKPSADTVTKVLNIFLIALHGVCTNFKVSNYKKPPCKLQHKIG
jgi:hypothetical protein